MKIHAKLLCVSKCFSCIVLPWRVMLTKKKKNNFLSSLKSTNSGSHGGTLCCFQGAIAVLYVQSILRASTIRAILRSLMLYEAFLHCLIALSNVWARQEQGTLLGPSHYLGPSLVPAPPISACISYFQNGVMVTKPSTEEWKERAFVTAI